MHPGQCDEPPRIRQHGRTREREAAALYARYQQRLSSFNAVDFDDLIRLPVQVLRPRARATPRLPAGRVGRRGRHQKRTA